MKPFKILTIALFYISILTLISAFLLMIIKYDRTSWFQKIWMGSKILTIKSIMETNNNELKPLISIEFNGRGVPSTKYSYSDLLKHSGKTCEKNYKKCGILDTLGNIMCIPEEEDCPINRIVFDSRDKADEYIDKGYHIGATYDDSDYMYYTNTSTDDKIVSKYVYTRKIQKYINEDNLVVDGKTYKEYYDSKYADYSNNYHRDDDYSSYYTKKSFYYYGFTSDIEVDQYILKKMDEEINIDKSYYTNVSDTLYLGNYIGFYNSQFMDEFTNVDLYKYYFNIFPNFTAYVFCYICAIACIIGGALYGFSLQYEDEQEVVLLYFLGIPYFVIFLGFYIYILYKYVDIYKNEKPFDLKNIKADPFLEDLLKNNVVERLWNENLVIIVIILFSCSFGIYLLNMIIRCIPHKRETSSSIEEIPEKPYYEKL